MSDMCGNCDCASKSQCVKKGNQYVVEAEMGYSMIMDPSIDDENDGCKCCGPSCACTSCSCCTH